MSVDGRDKAPRGLWATWAAFIAPFMASPMGRRRQGWRPVALRLPYLAAIVCLALTMLLILEGLRQYSNRERGLIFFADTDEVSSLQSFGYTYVPIIIALVLVIVWTATDFDVLRLEPYFQLSRPDGAPATVLFINYNFGQTILTPINAARRRHWLVLWVSLLTLSIRLILPALQSSVFELREVAVVKHHTMKSWPTLVDLETQATWMSTQANNTADSVLSSDEQVRRSRSAKYAVAPVEIPHTENDDGAEDTLWTLDQTLYWAQTSCRDLEVDNKLTVTIQDFTDTYPTVSWNAGGIVLENGRGVNTQCKLDFQYNSVFFPSTDFLQIRYWEPVISGTAAAEYSNRTQAFTATGCDPYGLFGMLIAVNASQTTPSSQTQYSASGVVFACDISYHMADARISMHTNSSIESIDIHPATTRTLTEAEFSVDQFQALLSEQAPYTSDMLFVRENVTTGGRTVTELPIISQELGELQPLLALDTSSVMTQAQFETRIRRNVKQAFILTLGRLFDPNREPAILPATRVTSQVAIAVVNFAALWSEFILGLATLTAIYLAFLYRSRQTFLQSDPGSIGAMCSITADIFHPTNILAQPHAEFDQFSTRQLRRIFRNARCYWRPGPNGNRLEILAEDGSPVELEETLQQRNDPMPHFLVIPFFIFEFLALAAVIILMGLVISSLMRDGRFSHLTQSDSSSLQVVLSFLPSVVASSVTALCTSIHRNLSVLEPWVHLQRGMASARASLSLNYASQGPLAIFSKAVRDRHLLLGLVSLACVVSLFLTVVAGGLFSQELRTSTLPANGLTVNYSQSIFWRTDFAAEFTEYDLIQTSITSGIPMLPWTSPNQSFVPIGIDSPNLNVLYGANTLGVGAFLDCKPLSPEEGLIRNHTSGHAYWQYSLFDDASVQCVAPMPPLHNKEEGIALSIHFLSPSAVGGHSEECQTSTMLVVGRWDYMADTPVTDNNTIALHCEPRVMIQNFSVIFDHKGQINGHVPIANSSVTEGTMYNNATVSLGQFNKVFAAIPESYVGNTTTHGGAYNISSYDWAGFLVARLYQRDVPDFYSLDPDRMIPLTRRVYEWVYSTYFSIWRDIYLNPLDSPVQAANATVIRSTWCMVPSAPSLAIALVIVAFDALVVLIVFGTRRGRFRGPRMPRSIGAVIPWIAHSRMLPDFANTYTWNNTQRRAHLASLDKRYGFRMFMGLDGRWRYAVDEEPNVSKPPDEAQDGTEIKTTSIQLQELLGLQPRDGLFICVQHIECIHCHIQCHGGVSTAVTDVVHRVYLLQSTTAEVNPASHLVNRVAGKTSRYLSLESVYGGNSVLNHFWSERPTVMQAVVFKGPLQVALEERPRPQIQDPTDVILKVRYTALCGSELHVFRGHQPSGTGFIMGHEFTGEVVETGANVKDFHKGDRVVSPFTVSCGTCFYCASGCSSRCSQCKLYGTAVLDGGQAEYVRVPLADSTLFHSPEAIDEKKLVLMADIFPTGFFAAGNGLGSLKPQAVSESTVLLFGCGPVGICALVSALEYRPKHLLAIDSVPDRLELAKSLGAEPWNFQQDGQGLRERVKALTDGRGADVVIEVVGHSSALRMGFEMLRPWGMISSVGVHNGEIPWTGNEAYGKNLRLQMGRCPVRSIFGEAMDLLAKRQDGLSFMSQDIRPLSAAVQAYDDFNHMRCQKVIFEADK